MAPSAQSYKNTLIFSVIASVLSLGLLAAMFFVPSLQAYFYLVFTIELGLVFVIVASLWTILSYEKKARAELNSLAQNGLASRSCPDYFTPVYTSEGETECRNCYVGRDPDGTPIALRFRNVSPDESDPGTVQLTDLDGKIAKDACRIVDPGTATANANFSVPWTEIRPKCTAVASA